MVNKSKILSDLSKIAVDAMSTFSSLRKEIETMVSLRVDKVINRMNLVKREEFDAFIAEKVALAEEERMLTSKIWTTEELMARGESFYATNCAACHQASGQGIPPVFPSLVGSEITMFDSKRHIEILMEGVQGSAMAAFGESYSEVDIASVITYTRQAWSNGENGDGVIVTPQDIVAYKNRIDL